MLDFIELGEYFLSWRLFLGFALTGLLCWLIVSVVSNQTAQWVICTPIALAGIILSFRWQDRADSG
jgi:hypothetical protein